MAYKATKAKGQGNPLPLFCGLFVSILAAGFFALALSGLNNYPRNDRCNDYKVH
jgi:hypothetical protein